jgi:hypothetical protein
MVSTNPKPSTLIAHTDDSGPIFFTFCLSSSSGCDWLDGHKEEHMVSRANPEPSTYIAHTDESRPIFSTSCFSSPSGCDYLDKRR